MKLIKTILFLLLLSNHYVYANGDVVAGKKVYNKCIGCHSFSYNRTGPQHCGLVGRMAGSLKGFNYSQAMEKLNIVWDKETLDAFLKAPFSYLPGTTMGFAGVKDNTQRKNLIAYLVSQSQSKSCQ